MWTREKEGGKQGGNCIGLKEGEKKVQSMEKKNVEREVWNRVQRNSGHRVLNKREKVTEVSHNEVF